MVGGVTRRGDGSKGPEARALAQHDVGVAPPGGERSGEALAQRRDPLGVIDVIVGQRDAPEPATRVDRLEQALEVLGSAGPGSTTQAGSSPDHPGVGARQRERSRVLGTQPQDVIAGEPLGVIVGIALAGALEILVRAAVTAGWEQRGHAQKLALPEDPPRCPSRWRDHDGDVQSARQCARIFGKVLAARSHRSRSALQEPNINLERAVAAS